MKIVLRSALIPAALAATAFSCSSAPTDSTQHSSESITGGYVDGYNGKSHPSVMALVLDIASSPPPTKCSATLIANRSGVGYALTASHCFDRAPNPASDAGRYTLVQGSSIYDANRTLYTVTDFVRLPYQFASTTGVPTTVNDFAIVRFNVGFASGMTPVPVLTPELDALHAGANAATSTAVEIVGFGAINASDALDGILQYADNFLTWVDTTSFGYSEANGGGACSGDSGGPVLVTLSDGAQYVAGVSSTAACGYHGEAGRVSAVYQSFIAPNTPAPTPACTPRPPTTRCTVAGGWRCCGADQGWVCGVCG